MITSIKSIYNSSDLNGDFLTQPLKIYHNFFAKKIEQSASLVSRLAWITVNVATGLFAYPLFGLLAAIGILIKLKGISNLKKHNESIKTGVEALQSGIKYSQSFSRNAINEIDESGIQMKVAREFTVTKDNVDIATSEIKKAIDSFSNQFKKVYLFSNGFIQNGLGGIAVQLQIRAQTV